MRAYRLFLLVWIVLLGTAVTVSVLAIVNPWHYARMDGLTVAFVMAAITVGSGALVLALLLQRRGSTRPLGFAVTGLVIACTCVLLGLSRSRAHRIRLR